MSSKAEIEEVLPEKPEWLREYGGLGTAQVAYRLQNQDITNRERWKDQHDWLLERADALYRAFEPRVAAIDDTHFEDPENE